jgi:solute carrier family 25 (mitochondrial carnitine/acylcarnitine transporter), member 20/29
MQAAGNATTASTEIVPFTLLGVKRLYHGIQVPLFTAGGMQTINFGLYDFFRRKCIRGFPEHFSHLSSVFVGGAVSGVFTSVLSTPIQLLKIQMQTNPKTTLREILIRDIFKTGRYGILYRGFGVTAVSDSIGRGMYFWTYECSKEFFTRQYDNQSLPLYAKIISASIAGVSSWFIMFPFDTVKTIVQSQYAGPSALEHLSIILKSGNARRILYRGCLYAVVRAAPVAATILPLYDAIYESMLKNL